MSSRDDNIRGLMFCFTIERIAKAMAAIILFLAALLFGAVAAFGQTPDIAKAYFAYTARAIESDGPAPGPVSDVCENCNGTGKVGDGRVFVECPVCDGTGKKKRHSSSTSSPETATSAAVAAKWPPKDLQLESAEPEFPSHTSTVDGEEIKWFACKMTASPNVTLYVNDLKDGEKWIRNEYPTLMAKGITVRYAKPGTHDVKFSPAFIVAANGRMDRKYHKGYHTAKQLADRIERLKQVR